MNLEEFMLPCLSKQLFGMECMGCGIQRAFILITKGSFEEAFFMYPAIYNMILFFSTIAISFIDKKRNYHNYIVTFGIFTAIVMVVSYFFKFFNF